MRPTLLHALLFTLATLLLGMAGPAAAHDTWVRPVPLRPLPAQPLPVELSAGNGLQPLSAPRQRRISQLSLAGPRRRQRAQGWQRQGKHLRARLGPAPRGVGCIHLSTRATLIEIDAPVVDLYLAEVQPPPALLAAWQAQRAQGLPWLERYAKDGKGYLRTTAGGPSWRRLRRLGQALEVLPLRDPTRLRPGALLPLQLLQHGQPVADAALRYFDRKGERSVRTDAEGKATVPVRCRGRQLVATTVLQPPAGPGAPWTSRFATLSCTVPGA